MDIELNKAYNAYLQNKTFFLTGKAGTGKSTFLKDIIKKNEKQCLVLAPTGMAAINVEGQTIHSFFRLPTNPLLDPIEDAYRFDEFDNKFKLIEAIDCIIIDEVSMVKADLMDTIDYSLRINGGNIDLPFGGKQMIFIGDLFQLPPIVSKEVKPYYDAIYKTPYFISAKIFEKYPVEFIELKTAYRQLGDVRYLSFLNEIREHEISSSSIDYINKKVGLKPDTTKSIIRLVTHNKSANEYNQFMLDSISSEFWEFKANIKGVVSKETKQIFDQALKLKIGAQISFNKNDGQGRYYNGSLGLITNISNDEITVKLLNGESITVIRHDFEIPEYKFDTKKNRLMKSVVSTISQFPLQLAWAITIHKSQGQTYENVIIDLVDGAFTTGQAYVAFSRVKSYDGLYLSKRLKSSDIIRDSLIKNYLKTIKEVTLEQEYNSCENCGKELENDSVFCRFCGFKIIKNGLTTEAGLFIPYKKQNKWGIALKNKKMVVDCIYEDAYMYNSSLTKVRLNRKWHVLTSGKIINNVGYDKIYEFSNGFALAFNNNKVGCINDWGDEIISCVYDDCRWPEEGIAIIMINNKFGYVSVTGVEIAPCIYDFTGNFHSGRSLVIKDKHFGVMDTAGDVIWCKSSYDYFSGGFSEGLCLVEINGKRGFIDIYGNEIIPCIYDEAESFQGEVAQVCLDDKWGFINKSGQLIIACKYDDYSEFENDIYKVEKNSKKGCVNNKGEEFIPCIYDNSPNFREGFAEVRRDNYSGIINLRGEEIIPCIYDSINDFEEGLACVLKNQKWGYLNEKGEVAIDLIYEQGSDFSNGLASVKKGDLIGYINKRGEVVIPFEYEECRPFREDLACVRKNRKYGFINLNNQIIIDFTYDEYSYFSEGLACVIKNGKTGYINKSNKVIVPFIYDKGGSFKDGLAGVKKNDLYGFIDNKGKIIIDFQFTHTLGFYDGIAKVDIGNQSGTIDKSGVFLNYLTAPPNVFYSRDDKYKFWDENGLHKFDIGYMNIDGTQYWE